MSLEMYQCCLLAVVSFYGSGSVSLVMHQCYLFAVLHGLMLSAVLVTYGCVAWSLASGCFKSHIQCCVTWRVSVSFVGCIALFLHPLYIGSSPVVLSLLPTESCREVHTPTAGDGYGDPEGRLR